MKKKTYSNFKLLSVSGDYPYKRLYGTVTETTKHLLCFWKNDEVKIIDVYCDYPSYWKFTDTGEFCPDEYVDNLAESWAVKHKLHLGNITQQDIDKIK